MIINKITMPAYYKPAEDSRGASYHIVNHGGFNLVAATEDEILNSDLTPCKRCVRFHNMVPIKQ